MSQKKVTGVEPHHAVLSASVPRGQRHIHIWKELVMEMHSTDESYKRTKFGLKGFLQRICSAFSSSLISRVVYTVPT